MSTQLVLASVIFVLIGFILSAVFVLTKFVGPKNEEAQLKTVCMKVVFLILLEILTSDSL